MEIDLSQFVGKQVRVAYRSGKVAEGRIKINDSAAKPYILHDNVCSTPYTRYGRYFINGGPDTVYDLTHIEELKPVSKYEELERQVAEMQKEIARLKREEKCPNLKPVEIVRTVRISPEQYLEHCKENDEHPTTEGYEKYYSCWQKNWYRFVDKDTYIQEIKTVEN